MQSRSASRRLLAVSLIINVALASGLLYVTWENLTLESHLRKSVEDSEELGNSLSSLRQQHELLQTQLEYYRQQADYYSRIAASEQGGDARIGQSTIKIVAVSQVEVGAFQTEYVGAVMVAEVELRRGEGRVFVDTIPRIGIDLQTSSRTAVLVAQNITGVSLQKTDVILTIRPKTAVDIVDGPSAGAAITIATIAAIWNHTFSATVYITGTVNPDGTVGEVGGIPYKALAAAEEGATVFMVPKGQSTVTIMVAREVHQYPCSPSSHINRCK